MNKSNYSIFAVFLLAIILSLFFISAQPSVNLGSAGNFAILSQAGISTTGTTSIVGSIGVSPIDSTAITGFGLTMDSSNTFSTSPLVAGKIYASDYSPPTPINMGTAINDMQTAYTTANGLVTPAPVTLGGSIGGLTLTPGIYTTGSNLIIPTDVTLSGGANDVWVFQIAGTLDISSATHVILSGGTQAKNIFWVVAGTTTLETNSVFNGNILDKTNIAINTGAVLNGRALSQTAVTLQSNVITIPTGSAQPICINHPNINYINNLQPFWNSTSSGKVYSAYYGPNNSYVAISPGNVSLYNGLEAGPISAGVTKDPINLDYEDQGLYAFNTTSTPINTFVSENLSYSVANQFGVLPAWIYIELNKSMPGDVIYQFVPFQQSDYVQNLDWHTVNASAGMWSQWTDLYNGIPTNPTPNFTLSDIALSNPGSVVNRVYLNEGIGNPYNNAGTTTVAWIHNVSIGNDTYIFALPDTTAPIITLNGSSTINLNVGDNYTELGANVTDNVDTCLVVNINGSVNTNTAGTYFVNYTATDTSGNTATLTRTVNVANLPVNNNNNGGGGNNQGSQGCITTWQCSDFSTCSNGIQTRTCNKVLYYCSTYENEPALNQSCTNQETTNPPTNTSQTTNNNVPAKTNYTPLWIVLGLIALGLIIWLVSFASRKPKVPVPKKESAKVLKPENS
jgi:hypothetical protein